jgi:putative ABC transport system ATP-binding protein
MLKIKNVSKTFHRGTINERKALDKFSLTIAPGEFVVIIGANGSGKSTLLNAIAGVFPLDSGNIIINGREISYLAEYKRAAYLGRVFQDPMMGTAANMTIAENLALADRRGKRRSLAAGMSSKDYRHYQEILSTLDLQLEERMEDKVGLLSGGQRQALTLMMATIKQPQMLLLDEHTAALDPKTAAKVLELSNWLIREHRLSTLMVTHNMQDAIDYGDRLVMMDSGGICFEAAGAKKKSLKVAEMIEMFAQTRLASEINAAS